MKLVNELTAQWIVQNLYKLPRSISIIIPEHFITIRNSEKDETSEAGSWTPFDSQRPWTQSYNMNWEIHMQPFQQQYFHQLEHSLHVLPSDTIPNSYSAHYDTLYNKLLTQFMRVHTQVKSHNIKLQYRIKVMGT